MEKYSRMKKKDFKLDENQNCDAGQSFETHAVVLFFQIFFLF